MTSAGENDPRRLLHQYRVFLDHDEGESADHKTHIDNIKELGRYNVNHYQSPVSVEPHKRPWGQQETMLKRVRAIAQKARRCALAEKNEMGWRLGLETEILSRFDIEVICGDSGLNSIFDDRAGEGINHPPEIAGLLKKPRPEQPDRIVGLRATDRIARILNAEGPRGDVASSIETTPFRCSLDPLLFPFLVLEAKSEKSDDSFSQIYLQTAFAIRALLGLQRELINATPANRRSGTRPLLWFLANKGQDWRIHIAYVKERGAGRGPDYRILQVWAGNITHEDHALSLLLIIDYIGDWARDVYRKDIIDNLLSLVTDATPSLFAATDIMSTRDPFEGIGVTQDAEEFLSIEPPQQFNQQNLLKFFDNDGFMLRDARHMYREVCGLYITLENIGKLFSSAKNPQEAVQVSRQLWRALVGAETWSVTAASLDAIEELWTGKSRECESFQSPEQPFLAIFFISSYISQGQCRHRVYSWSPPGIWDQHHELTYIAVAEDALAALRTRTEYFPRFLEMNLKNIPRVPKDWIQQSFEKHRFMATRKCLLRALDQRIYQSYSERGKRSFKDNFGGHEPSNFRGAAATFRPSFQSPARLEPNAYNGITKPWQIYDRIKVGMAEPNESFLRVSKSFEVHEAHGRHSSDNSTLDETVDETNADILIVQAYPVVEYQCKQWACIFVIDPSRFISNNEVSVGANRLFLNPLIPKFTGRGTQGLQYKVREQSRGVRSWTGFLEHVAMQYQCIDSLDSCSDGDMSLSEWAGKTYDRLSSQPLFNWRHSKKDTIDGIKTVGAGYGFGKLLSALSGSFQQALQQALDHEMAQGIADEHLDTDDLENLQLMESLSPSNFDKGSNEEWLSPENNLTATTRQPDSSCSESANKSVTAGEDDYAAIEVKDSPHAHKRAALAASRDSGDEDTDAAKRRRVN